MGGCKQLQDRRWDLSLFHAFEARRIKLGVPDIWHIFLCFFAWWASVLLCGEERGEVGIRVSVGEG